MKPTKQLITLEKKINTVPQKVHIKSEKDLVAATKVLSTLNQYNDTLQDEKEKITKPLNEALKNARALFKPLETKLSTVIDAIRSEMTSYQTKLINDQRKKEDEIARKLATNTISIEKAVEKISTITVEQKITTDAGSIRFKPVQKLVITDPSKVPCEYHIIDESKLLTDLKQGKTVPGATMETIQVPINYR